MSSLLADLKLDYEQLFNDPIEMGIHYGHSILNYFTPDYYSSNKEQIFPRRFSRFIDKQRNPVIKSLQVESLRETKDYTSPIIKRQPTSSRENLYYQKRKPVFPNREISFSIDTSRYNLPRREVSRSQQLIGQI